MNKLIYIVCFLFSAAVNAQEIISPLFPSDSAKHELNLNFSGYYHNTSLSNEFLGLFYHGGYLDSSLKNEMSENLFSENRIGGELSYGIRYRNFHSHLFGKPSWGWYASVSNHAFYHARYSENAFNLLFYGNSRFAGDTIPLQNVHFESMQFQKFTFGGFHKDNHSYIGVSFLKGQDYKSFGMNRANLYTAPLGEEIALDLHASYEQTDTLKRGLNAFNGWGLSTDLVFYLNMGKNRNIKFQNTFQVAIRDLGFIRWNEKSLLTETDSSYYFDGFEVEDIFDSASYQFSDRMRDTLKISPVNKGNTTILPFSFSFAKVADPVSGDKIQGFYGIRVRAFAWYKPLFYAGIFYRPVKNVSMNLYASAGGYGKFRIGYSVNACILKKINVSLASSDLIGWTKNGSGKDASIQVSYVF